MNLQYVREFVVLADTGNYLAASEELFISQSSLSKHIISLERELDVTLFNRTTRRIELSEYGQLFLPYARRIAGSFDEFQTALSRALNPSDALINIGFIPIMIQYGVAELLPRIQEELPGCRVELTECYTNQLLPMLQNGECDFAFVAGTDEEESKELVRIPVRTDWLATALPPEHPLARGESVKLSDLKYEKFLFPPRSTMTYKLCCQACSQAGFTPNVVYSGQKTENKLDMARAGYGVPLLLKKRLLAYDAAGLSVLDIEPRFYMHFDMVYRKDLRLTPAARYFIRYVRGIREKE